MTSNYRCAVMCYRQHWFLQFNSKHCTMHLNRMMTQFISNFKWPEYARHKKLAGKPYSKNKNKTARLTINLLTSNEWNSQILTHIHKTHNIQNELLLNFDCDAKAWRMGRVCRCMYVVSSSRNTEDWWRSVTDGGGGGRICLSVVQNRKCHHRSSDCPLHVTSNLS